MEAGLVNQWKVRTWARIKIEEAWAKMESEEGDIILKDDQVATIITLDHVQGAFYLYIIMLICASLVFGTEIIQRRKEKRDNRVFTFTP